MRTLSLAALLTAALLAGCGGGAGSSAPLPAGGSGNQTQSQAQTANTAIEAAFANTAGAEADQAASGRNLGVMAIAGRVAPQSFGNLPYGQCVPDGSYAGLLLAAPQSSGATTSYEITYFRDPACSNKARDITLAVTTQSKGVYSVNRVATNYDASGNQLTQRTSTIAVNGTHDNFSAQASAAIDYAGATVGSAMNEWATSPSSQSGIDNLSGDGARISNASAASYGASWALAGTPQATKTLNSDGSTTYAIVSNATVYSGAVGSLAIAPATFPGPFSVQPSADALGTGSLTTSETIDANGLPTNLTVNGTLPKGATLAVTTSAGAPIQFNGTVTGTGGTTLATFAVDQFGNGTLTLAGGTTRSIYDWHAFK
jgi:hypothetical protein